MAYPTRADLVGDSTVAELTTLSADDQDALYESAVNAVEDYTGQTFTAATEARLLDSKGGVRLYLPWRIETLTALEASGTAFSAIDVDISYKRDYLTLTPTAGISNYYLRALNDVMDFSSRTFPIGENKVSITGVWGWTTCPKAVALALRWDMEDMARAAATAGYGALAAYKAQGASKVRQDTLEVWFESGNNKIGLPSRAVALLEPYVWLGDLGRAV